MTKQTLQRQTQPTTVPAHAPSAFAPRGFGDALSHLPAPAPQAKLTVNQPGDKYEQEADSVADSVMRMGDTDSVQREDDKDDEEEKLQMKPLAGAISPLVQREEKDDEEEEGPVQAKALPGVSPRVQREDDEDEEKVQAQRKETGGLQSADVSGVVSQGLSGGGQPLDEATRSYMEPRFGHDFSQVRIHTDSRASQSSEQIAARAYTVGSDIAFRSGEFRPASGDGMRLLAHELTHVVQQGGISQGGISAVGRVQRDTIETERVAKLNNDYQAAVTAGNLSQAATLLKGFNDTEIQAKLKKLSQIELRAMYFACPAGLTRVTGPIAAIDPKVTEDATVKDAEMDRIKTAFPTGITVALYANYDYGDATAKANNQAFLAEAQRFASSEGAVGLKGSAIALGVPIPVKEASEVLTVVQSIHRALIEKNMLSQALAGAPSTADASNTDIKQQTVLGAKSGAAQGLLPDFTKIKSLALFAHGMSYGIGMDHANNFTLTVRNVKSFVSGLTGALAKDLRVELFSCNAALGKEEGPQWGKPSQGERKGQDSFAAAMAGALDPDASVYSHTAAGHTTELTSARVFGKDAGGGSGGLAVFDVLYKEDFIQSEIKRLFPDADPASLHDSLRDEMWRHYQNRMFDFKDMEVAQKDGTSKKTTVGVPKTYKPGEHTLGQDQFAHVDQAQASLHQHWTDIWIADKSNLARIKPKVPVVTTPVQRAVQRDSILDSVRNAIEKVGAAATAAISRSWPTLLPRAGKPGAATPEQCASIVASVTQNRAQISENIGLRLTDWGGKKGAGYEYDGNPKADPAPNVSDKDARRTHVNQVVWQEVAGEGSSASINTYDGGNADAKKDKANLTWGRGFLSAGQLGEVMTHLFAIDPGVQNLLLDAGFTYQGGKWLAVDTATGMVAEGQAALSLIRFDKKVLSLLIQIGEDPAHAQNVVDAEWQTVANHAGAVPQAIIDQNWSDEAIAFAAHCVHWGSSWGAYTSTGGDISSMIRIMAPHTSRETPEPGGSIITASSSTNTFLGFARLGQATGVIRRKNLLQGPDALPKDIAQSTDGYKNHIFFNTGGGKYYHLNP